MSRPASRLAILALAIAGCTASQQPQPVQVSGALLTTEIAALSAENVYLASTKVSAAEAQKLRALRLQADAAIQQVIAAEKSGGNLAGVLAAARVAVDAYLAAANAAKGP